jgi:hypothetical protein
MDYYDIQKYAKLGSILEKAEKCKFEVAVIKIKTGTDRTEEVYVNDFSVGFRALLSEALKDEQQYIKEGVIKRG